MFWGSGVTALLTGAVWPLDGEVLYIVVTLMEGVRKSWKRGKGHKYGSLGQVKGVRVLKEGAWTQTSDSTFPRWIKPICMQHWDWWAQFGSPHFYTEIDGGRARERTQRKSKGMKRHRDEEKWKTEVSYRVRERRNARAPPPRHSRGRPCSCGVNKS